MSAASIKTAVKTILDELVTDGVLGGATISDLKKDPLAADIPTWPHAFLMPPSTESETLDTRSNLRTYTYEILVLWKAENIESATEVEADIEAILNKFDNNPTLGGNALGGFEPVSSAPEPFQHQARQLIAASVVVKAKDHVALTF